MLAYQAGCTAEVCSALTQMDIDNRTSGKDTRRVTMNRFQDLYDHSDHDRSGDFDRARDRHVSRAVLAHSVGDDC